jgi:multisubunit Na+/H+ antiporter MnhC subunit
MLLLLFSVSTYIASVQQLIPVISSLTPFTTAVPLILVLALTAVKDAYDDYVSF